MRLADREKEERQRAEYQNSVTEGVMEFADALATLPAAVSWGRLPETGLTQRG